MASQKSKLFSKAAPKSYPQNYCSSQKLFPKVTAKNCFPKLCFKGIPPIPQSYFPKLWFGLPCKAAPQRAAPAPLSSSPKLLRKAAPQSGSPQLLKRLCFKPVGYSPKRLSKAAPQSCYRKLPPQSCILKLVPKAAPKLRFFKACVRSCRAKLLLLSKAAPQSCSTKLFPKDARQSCSREQLRIAAPQSC